MKDLDRKLDDIKSLSEKEKMAIVSILIADVLIRKNNRTIESSVTFGAPDIGYETIVKLNAELIVNEK